MAKTGVTSNVTPAMRKFEQGFSELIKNTGNQGATLATMAMDDIRKKGLIKGEHANDNKRQYEDIKVIQSGIIEQRRKSQKGRSKSWSSYKHYGKVRKRKNKYAPRDRGERSVKRVFHKSRIAVRTGGFYRIFEHKTSFNSDGKKWTQTRHNAKISIQNFKEDKEKTAQTTVFSFNGEEGKSLRVLSFGKKRTVAFTLDNGRQIKGSKQRRPIVLNGLRRTYRNWNKIMNSKLLPNYKKEFNRIK